MSAYYNENDAFAAAWLRSLIAAGLIAPGYVDERDIRDVQPADLEGFTRCHFFAGIGGWDYALQLAGWTDEPVWTGSCPCQPFSAAGKGEGFNDSRHLWPSWFRLIRECKPPVVFGEQVASKDGLAWIDTVSTQMEAENYAFGAADLCAAGVGTPHIRQRLWFVADANGQRRAERAQPHGGQVKPGEPSSRRADARGRGSASAVGHTEGFGRQPALKPRALRIQGATLGEADPLRGFWRGADWIYCRDGKYRAVEAGTFPLAHGVPNRVGTLRGAGNAIVPQVGAVFIQAYLEAIDETL